MDLGEYSHALDDFAQALAIDPEWASAYTNRGNLYGRIGEFELALNDYDRAVQLEPTRALVYANRGIALAGLGRYDEAERDLETAISLDPTSAAPYFTLSFVFRERAEYPTAIEYVTQYLNLIGDEDTDERRIATQFLSELETLNEADTTP